MDTLSVAGPVALHVDTIHREELTEVQLGLQSVAYGAFALHNILQLGRALRARDLGSTVMASGLVFVRGASAAARIDTVLTGERPPSSDHVSTGDKVISRLITATTVVTQTALNQRLG
jgi:hypothetical protein